MTQWDPKNNRLPDREVWYNWSSDVDFETIPGYMPLGTFPIDQQGCIASILAAEPDVPHLVLPDLQTMDAGILASLLMEAIDEICAQLGSNRQALYQALVKELGRRTAAVPQTAVAGPSAAAVEQWDEDCRVQRRQESPQRVHGFLAAHRRLAKGAARRADVYTDEELDQI